MSIHTKAVIIDDEVNNASLLNGLIERYCPTVEIIGMAYTYDDAKTLLEKEKPQILFLDIELDTGNAFHLLEEVPGLKSKVVFTTAHHEYALKAFKYNAVDYLLKPISIEDLIRTVDRINSEISDFSFTFKEQIERLNTALETKENSEVIIIPSLKKIDVLKISEISYIKSDGNYSIFSVKGKQVVSTKNLGFYEDLLPTASFCRVHHSYMINIRKIETIRKDRSQVCLMHDGKQVPISSRKYQSLIDKLSQL